MNSFINSPLEVPILAHSMEGLEQILEKFSYEVFPVLISNDEKKTYDSSLPMHFSSISKAVEIKFSLEMYKSALKKISLQLDIEKINQFFSKLLCSSKSDFEIIAQSLVASLEATYGNIIVEDSNIYYTLIKDSLNKIKENLLLSKITLPKSAIVHVSANESDFLLTIARVFEALSNGDAVVILCASTKLMLPLFVFTQLAYSASLPQGALSFITINQNHAIYAKASSIQMILRPADLDSASRSIVKATAYLNGTTSWRPSIILVQQEYEKEFQTKITKLILNLNSTGDTNLTDENSHLHSYCHIPSYLIKDFNDFVGLLSSEGTTVIRPSENCGPVFVFDATPSSLAMDKYKKLPMGPISIVLPFRTANEGLKLLQYFGERDNMIIGSVNCTYNIPRSATIWTDSISLAFEVLAKVNNYTTLSVNSDLRRLRCSFYSSIVLSNQGCNLDGLQLIPALSPEKQVINTDLSVTMMKLISSTTLILQTMKRFSFDQRVASLKSIKQFSDFSELFNDIRSNCLTYLIANSHTGFNEQLIDNVSSQKLFQVRNWLEPVGPIIVMLKSGELSPKIQKLSVASIALGNPVILLSLNGVEIKKEMEEFCNSINSSISKHNPNISKSHLMIQIKQFNQTESAIALSLSELQCTAILVSCLSDDSKTGDLNISNLCKNSSIYLSLGQNLFAN